MALVSYSRQAQTRYLDVIFVLRVYYKVRSGNPIILFLEIVFVNLDNIENLIELVHYERGMLNSGDYIHDRTMNFI